MAPGLDWNPRPCQQGKIRAMMDVSAPANVPGTQNLIHGVTFGTRAPMNGARNLKSRIEEFDETAPDYAFSDSVLLPR